MLGRRIGSIVTIKLSYYLNDFSKIDLSKYQQSSFYYESSEHKFSINKEPVKLKYQGVAEKNEFVYDYGMDKIVFTEYTKGTRPTWKADYHRKSFINIHKYLDEEHYFQQLLLEDLPFTIDDLKTLFKYYAI